MLTKIPDLEHLTDMDVRVLRAIKREGERHLRSYYETMKHFQFPERRLKCFDTVMYERVLPRVERILREKEAGAHLDELDPPMEDDEPIDKDYKP